MRGGGGSFGVVTAVEFSLYRIPTAYAGMLVWDPGRGEVLRAWAAVGADRAGRRDHVVPDPQPAGPMPELPAPFRGRSTGGGRRRGARHRRRRRREILAPCARSVTGAGHLRPGAGGGPFPAAHGPGGADPGGVRHERRSAAFPRLPIDAFLARRVPGRGRTLLMAELRQLGGALGRPAAGAGALPMLDGEFVLFAVADRGDSGDGPGRATPTRSRSWTRWRRGRTAAAT